MSRSVAARLLALLAVALLSGACVPSLKENAPREPKRALPETFGAPASAHATTELFHTPELRALIDVALANNQELNIALQEIIIAKNEVYARRGEYLPKVSAGAGVGVERVGENTSQGVSDRAHGLPPDLGDFQFGLTGSWEVDVWRKLRDAAAAADVRYRASIEARNFMITQIVAEIARSYYELIGVDNQLEVLDRNIAVQASALEVVKLQKQAARVTELAVQRFEAEVLKNRSHRFALEQERVQLENRINFLVGRYPQPVARDAAAFRDALPAVAGGLPSDLLENRPDVRRAELELQASKLDVRVAKAAFYPSLSIEAGVGYRAFNPVHLVATPDSIVYNLAGNLTAPLLNRQAITAQYRTANALQLQAVFNYERTLLAAFTDVVNQLSLVDKLQKSYELKEQQVETLARSVEISSILFQSARADYMEVLLTRRDSLEAAMALVETRKAQLGAVVGVYQALGGGWRRDGG